MNSTSVAKPRAIIMVGLPGAGKSFFARQFADTFSSPIVSFDRIRYELFNNPNYSHDEEAIISRVAHYMILELIKTNKTFVVDGGFNVRNDRYELGKVLRSAGYDILLCWIQTDTLTCKQRAFRRNPHKKDDLYNISITQDIFDDLTRRFSPPTGQEKFVVISGKHTYATQARTLLKRLAEPRQQAAAAPPTRSHTPTERRINVVSDEQAPPPPTRQSISIN